MSNYDFSIFDDTMNTNNTNNTIDQFSTNVTLGSGIGGGGGGGLLGGYNITTSPGTIYTTSTSGAGQTLTWNGVNPVWTTTPLTPLKVNGDAEIDGDLKVKGKSLSEAIENIEKRLAILHPNPELEEKWEELKALGERYRELEKDILEKEKMWEILKK